MNLLATVAGLAVVFALLATAVRAASIPERVRVLDWIGCTVFRGSHSPARTPLGGQRCVDCGLAGADMGELGFEDGGYVPPVRRLYDRDRDEFIRTTEWNQGSRGW